MHACMSELDAWHFSSFKKISQEFEKKYMKVNHFPKTLRIVCNVCVVVVG